LYEHLRDQATVSGVIDSDRWRSIVSRLRLSPREREIVESMLFGFDTELGIADRLQMSQRTVQTRVQRLRQKIGATTREQLLVKLLLACLADDSRT
jgi:DNA-binding CsgD family transcriptional regulator